MVMSRRKQAKPRAFKHDESDSGDLLAETNENSSSKYNSDLDEINDDTKGLNDQETNDIISESEKSMEMLEDIDSTIDKDSVLRGNDLEAERLGDVDEEKSDEDLNDMEEEQEEDSCDSFYSDIYSSHTSSSFSPALSETGVIDRDTETPNPYNKQENHLTDSNNVKCVNGMMITKKGSDKLNGNGTDRNVGVSEKSGTDKPKHYQANGDGSYHCQFCDKSFPRLGYLKKHEQSHAEHMPFKCDYCARLFKHKRSRDRHTKLHTGDRRYRCPHCEAAFSRSDHLKIHMKTHDNQKPFQCTICNRGYNTAAALTSHMQNHKKQAALLGAGSQPLNYSPRSTGSASSGQSLIHPSHPTQNPPNHYKRKYMSTIAMKGNANNNNNNLEFHGPIKRQNLSIGGTAHHHHPPPMTNNGPPSSINNKSPSLLYCMYCTKNDFQSIDQLHMHIQAMHSAALTVRETSYHSNPHLHPHLSHLHLACEFCTMKFPDIPSMFHHIRLTHIDRITSPNSYFNKIATDLYGPTNRIAFSPNGDERTPYRSIKSELNSPTSERDDKLSKPSNTPTIMITDQPIKEEEIDGDERSIDEQDSPTDLSKKSQMEGNKSGEQIPSPINRNQFLCNQCNAALPDFEAFRNHLKNHLNIGPSYVCPHCGIQSPNQSDYDRHIMTHFLIVDTTFDCSMCENINFQKSDDLQKHLQDQHVQTCFKCCLCSEVFDTKVQVQVHCAVAHTVEVKQYRCSGCVLETFKTEKELKQHVRSRHRITAIGTNPLQCIFCRTVCGSELEMHFHLSAHARQYRCPTCLETFHVEFLLDRHMETHHGSPGAQSGKHSMELNGNYPTNPSVPFPYKGLNNNNNILDYHYVAAAAAAAVHGGGSQGKGSLYGNFIDPSLTPNSKPTVPPNQPKFPATNFLYPHYYDSMSGKSRYLDAIQVANKNFLGGLYPELTSKNYGTGNSPYGSGPVERKSYTATQGTSPTNDDIQRVASINQQKLNGIRMSNQYPTNQSDPSGVKDGRRDTGFSCGICERTDFNTETEVQTHRKIVHNVKTGVSLRCAYCNGNFRSRSELESHMKMAHNANGKHKCLICDEIFPSPAVLAEHKLSHSKVAASGKCSHCSFTLSDVTAFKAHMIDHNSTANELPTQCICCRQTLHSEYEIGLHAKFHTNNHSSADSLDHPNSCVLCLEILPTNIEAKICEKCFKKHNFSSLGKYPPPPIPSHLFGRPPPPVGHYNQLTDESGGLLIPTSVTVGSKSNHCYLCNKTIGTVQKLQEHLIEHSFEGVDRGFSCYVCSAVFTGPQSLIAHMPEHGLHTKPYDCNKCSEQFYFRTEMENHIYGEHGDVGGDQETIGRNINNIEPVEQNRVVETEPINISKRIKLETSPTGYMEKNVDDDEEYIEVEKMEGNHETGETIHSELIPIKTPDKMKVEKDSEVEDTD